MVLVFSDAVGGHMSHGPERPNRPSGVAWRLRLRRRLRLADRAANGILRRAGFRFGWRALVAFFLVTLLGFVANATSVYEFAKDKFSSSNPPVRMSGDLNVAVARFGSFTS